MGYTMTFQSISPVLDAKGISHVTAVPTFRPGDRVVHNGEEYVFCYNAGGASANAGYGVKFITGASGYSVAMTSITDTFNPFVGVVKHASIPSAEYGWVLTKGFTTVKMVSATTADYKMIALGAAGVFIEASGTTTMGTAVAVGHCMNADTGAGGSVYAFIKSNA